VNAVSVRIIAQQSRRAIAVQSVRWSVHDRRGRAAGMVQRAVQSSSVAATSIGK
jgi:hypothetical protein